MLAPKTVVTSGSSSRSSGPRSSSVSVGRIGPDTQSGGGTVQRGRIGPPSTPRRSPPAAQRATSASHQPAPTTASSSTYAIAGASRSAAYASARLRACESPGRGSPSTRMPLAARSWSTRPSSESPLVTRTICESGTCARRAANASATAAGLRLVQTATTGAEATEGTLAALSSPLDCAPNEQERCVLQEMVIYGVSFDMVGKQP